MVRNTKASRHPDSEIAGFYDTLAVDYDEMTSFDKRFIHEKPFFRLLTERYKIESALDAGCGTGFHSLLLAQLGVRVTAVDLSPAMLRRVEHHAKEMKVKVQTVESSFRSLHRILDAKYDAVFSMGNSLAHVLSSEDLVSSLRSFASLLRPRGIIFLQNLNYDRILKKRERIQSVKESNDKIFVRFYDYDEDALMFNILTLYKQDGSIVHKLEAVKLRPLLHDEISKSLRSTGFTDIKCYGGVSMEEYRQDDSKDLVVLAVKGG